jgi:hypothetical protein
MRGEEIKRMRGFFDSVVVDEYICVYEWLRVETDSSGQSRLRLWRRRIKALESNWNENDENLQRYYETHYQGILDPTIVPASSLTDAITPPRMTPSSVIQFTTYRQERMRGTERCHGKLDMFDEMNFGLMTFM